MSELGARLRQAREQQGLSLAQASTDTRILQQSLIALEEGAFQRLPDDVVIRGFIRNYAQYLGLPSDELIEQYRRERGVTDPIRVQPLARHTTARSYVLPSFFGVFFVTIALVGLAYIALNAVGRLGDRASIGLLDQPTASIPPPSPLPTATPGLAPAIMPSSTTAPSRPNALASTALAAETTRPAGGVARTPTVNPSALAPIMLEVAVPDVRGSENSWVRVQTDGNTVFEGIMRAGEKLSFAAQRRVLVRAGNPPDVLITVNGLQQGSLGQSRGQPVNWVWPPE